MVMQLGRVPYPPPERFSRSCSLGAFFIACSRDRARYYPMSLTLPDTIVIGNHTLTRTQSTTYSARWNDSADVLSVECHLVIHEDGRVLVKKWTFSVLCYFIESPSWAPCDYDDYPEYSENWPHQCRAATLPALIPKALFVLDRFKEDIDRFDKEWQAIKDRANLVLGGITPCSDS